MGTATLSANGGVIVSLTTNANAAFATTSLLTGPHQIVAVYSGDGTFAPSTSAPAPNMVEDFTNANTGPASQNVLPGATTTYTFTLAPVGATTFLNDVTVAIDGLPTGSTYTFTPATIKAGSGSTQVVLNVQTSSSLNARNQRATESAHSRHNETANCVRNAGPGWPRSRAEAEAQDPALADASPADAWFSSANCGA